MWGMGIRPGDTVFIAAIFSLYMGSWGTLAGSERLRCKSFPFGAGAPGMTARAAMWLANFKPQAFYGTPSFALHLAEVARAEGYEPRDFGLKVLFFSGEPGASVPGVRDKIREAYDTRVIDCGSMAEMSPFMNVAGSEQSDQGMLCWQDVVYTEVCDPKTFRRMPYGERGTPVYTHLERTSQPMIRLVSGDLTLWVNEPNPCGRTYPRLPNGIFGRIDDMITIRGENVYPSEIDAVLNQLADYGGEHRIIITREGAMDELLVRVEASPGVFERDAAAVAAMRAETGERMQKVLGLRAVIEIVPPGTFPRTDFKARRVVDDREAFRQMSERLSR
jgi:phenylacetate-CoA ligase